MSDEKYRVLILDDDYELGILLKEYLQNTKKCAVTYFSSEADFWACLSQETFDILFLDYKLPGTTGLDILSRMGQVGINIPTVMMTGEGSENIAARAIQSGALDYLVKGEYSLTSLPPLIQKAVRLREMQREMHQYLEQIRYQAMLLDNMRDAVVVWGLDGTVTYWNTAAEQLYGATAAERLGQRVNDVYFPCFDPPITLPDLNKGGNNQIGNFQIEHRFQRPDGGKTWISAHITTLYNESSPSDPIGYMNVARDITPRKLEQEALVKSENFIQRILNTSPNIIYILDLQNQKISYVNPEIKAILGYEVDKFNNSPFSAIIARVHPEDRTNLAHHLHDLQALQDGDVVEIEFRIISQAREWRWLKSREAIFARGEMGEPVEIIGVIQDMTANKQAEAKLKHRLDSEKLLSTVSNNFINLARTDIDKGVASAMQLVTRFIQVDYGSIFLLQDNQFTPYYDYDNRPEQQAGSIPYRFNVRLPQAPWLMGQIQGQEIVVLNRPEDLPAQAVVDQALMHELDLRSIILIPMVYNNALYGLLGFGTTGRELSWTEDDIYVLKTFGEMITNALIHKQVDQALRKSEARYRAIVEDHQTEMICRFLPDTTLTFVNEAYCRYYSLDRLRLVGQSFLEPVLAEDQPLVREHLSGLSTGAAVNHFEQRIQLVSGEIRWQEWVSRAIFDQHNDFIEFQAVGRDITERKQMEEQLKTAQTHLAQAARLASIGELASGVAHQISNPLTTIIADAQILSQQLGKHHPGRESSEAIVQAGWRAQEVINELMKFSQPTQSNLETLSVNDTIDKALLLAGAHVQASGAKLCVNLDPDLPKINGNPRQLADLWVNLLLLARTSFTDGLEHQIKIVTRVRDSRTIEVDISDDGIPVSPVEYDKIFEPQLIPSGAGRGTGMELSICREIVRQNRGQISISGSEKETTFQILFFVEGM